MTLDVYILTYNRSKYLKEAIDSVLNQTYTDFDLYVIDNCSTDNTQEMVAEYTDSRVHYYRQPTNVGSFKNFTFAITHCKADFFVLFHDDDIMLPNMLEKEIEILSGNEELAAVSGNSIIFDEINTSERLYNKCMPKRYAGNEIIRDYIRQSKTLVYPSIMYRNSFMKKTGILPNENAGPCADVILYSDIALAGGIIYEMNDVVMKTRFHPAQDSEVNCFPMRIQLYEFLSTDEKYSSIYKESVDGRKKSFDRIMRLILKMASKSDMTVDEMKHYKKEFNRVFLLKNRHSIWTFMVDAYCCFPKIMKPIYSILFNAYVGLKRFYDTAF